MARLEITKLGKSFGRKQVLNALDLRIDTGEIVAIMGRNGSGKSTLFQIIFGVTTASEGQMRIDGAPLLKKQEKIAYLPQYAFLPARMRVRTLIQRSLPALESQDTVFYAPKISKIESQRVGQLSVGERRYLATLLLGQLAHPFLLLDEPFSMLEPIQVEYIKAYLVGLKASKGILLADHYYEDALQTVDRTLLLQNGRLEAVSGTEDLVEKGYLPRSRL